MIEISLFESLRSSKPITATLPWSGLRDMLQVSEETNNKESVALWCPASFRANTSRKNENVVSLNAIVLDLDKQDPKSCEGVFDRIAQAGYAAVIHSTYSHTPESWCLRVVIPLAMPIMARAWPQAWRAFVEQIAPSADRHCGDLARQYYLPCHRPGQEPFFLEFTGSAYNFQPCDEPSEIEEISREALNNAIMRWRRSTDPGTVEASKAWQCVANGESFAAPGERDKTLFRMIGVAVKMWPTATPKAFFSLMQKSLELMEREHPYGAITVRAVIDKVRRWKEFKEEKQLSIREQNIKLAFGGKRSHPYEESELEEMQATLGVDTLKPCWILQHGADYYVLGPGCQYQHAKRESLYNTARVLLAPAPVDLMLPTKEGIPREATISELLRNYSLPVKEVSRSIAIQKPSIDFMKRKVTLPTCPMRDLKPKFSEEIDLWLRLLAGDAFSGLEAWISHLPDLENPLTALILLGAKNVGKSLLPVGLSRIWTTQGPTDFDHALSEFNSALERCPLCFSDERLPTDFRGRVRTDEIRAFIQSTQRSSNEKFRARTTLEGAARLIVAANNEQIFNIKDELTPYDIEAIAERYQVIHVSPDASTYLDSLGGREYIHKRWVEGDAIAEHALYLWQQRATPRVGRFGVEHSVALTSKRIGLRETTRSAICEWLIKYTQEPKRLVQAGGRVLVASGRLCVHVNTLVDFWDIYIKNVKLPATGVLSVALRGLSLEQIRDEDGLILHVIDTERLAGWAEANAYCDPDALIQILRAL